MILIRKLCIAMCCLITAGAFAQEGEVWKEPSKESRAYHKYRLFISHPRFGSKKVLSLLETKLTEEDESSKLNQSDYMNLSPREKFTYHVMHAESYSQNCDAIPPIADEHKKIFGQLPDAFGEYSWSERQSQFLRSNRDSVIQWIKECVTVEKRLGVNLKHAIIECNARELIPFLVSTYNIDKKDHDILTVFMLLMKNNEYKEFITSLSYKKLYAGENSYYAFLNFNVQNEELIIKRATDFYNGLPK